MKTLFQAQESSVSPSRPRNTRKRLVVLLGVLAILGLVLWESLVTALRATSGHS